MHFTKTIALFLSTLAAANALEQEPRNEQHEGVEARQNDILSSIGGIVQSYATEILPSQPGVVSSILSQATDILSSVEDFASTATGSAASSALESASSRVSSALSDASSNLSSATSSAGSITSSQSNALSSASSRVSSVASSLSSSIASATETGGGGSAGSATYGGDSKIVLTVAAVAFGLGVFGFGLL